MNLPSTGPGSPRPTVGHHFAALLQCPQKAWQDYHADPRLKSDPTAYLKALQREGLDHEKGVSRTLYPDAVRIPERGDPQARAADTIRAMEAGAGAILQGYFREDDGCGVADVLELVGTDARSRTGHVYRIGEFKRATALSTGHVMQVAWYSELLTGIQGTGLDEAFFILGDGTRTTIRLGEVQDAYEGCKAELLLLRANGHGPGPHLCRWCPTCQWRGLCLPEIVEGGHVSLLPGVSRRHAQAFADIGVQTWADIADLPEEAIGSIGFDGHESRRLRDACDRLLRGEVVLRYSIDSGALSRFTVVTLDYGGEDGKAARIPRDLPKAIWYESGGNPCEIPVVAESGAMASSLSPLVKASGLAFYGATDMIGFLKLVPKDLGRKARCLDVLDLIERLVHAPLPGLELDDVVRFADPSHARDGTRPGRIRAVRAVIDWLAGPRAVVA